MTDPYGTSPSVQDAVELSASDLRRNITLALIGALSVFAAVLLSGVIRAGWVFEYPLDDVYIHLAMASEIARGGYGVNAGEYASAASSPIYPLFLAIAPDTEVQRLLPLMWNVVGLCLSCVLWVLIITRAGLRGAWVTALAIIGPIATGGFAAAFASMEHSLHAAASLAIVYGMLRLAQGGGVSLVLIAGIFFAPLFRFEGAALALFGACLVFLSGRRALGLGLIALAFGPLAGFCLFLTSLGLDPLPNSVLTKLPSNTLSELGFVTRLWVALRFNLTLLNGQALGLIGVIALILPLFDRRLREGLWPFIAMSLFLAAFAHLSLASVGWMGRYEHYALISLGAGAIMLAAQTKRWMLTGLACVPLLMSGATYLDEATGLYPVNPRAIHLQQAQMARFAQDYYQARVAINDLGRVVWGNEHYVLDLWGLANTEAREIRLSNPEDGWGTKLADARDVKFAMIYRDWLAPALADDWIFLGNLTMNPFGGTLGSRLGVDFHARDIEAAEALRPMLQDWAMTLPQDAAFIFGDVP